jgi:hypothetical protein
MRLSFSQQPVIVYCIHMVGDGHRAFPITLHVKLYCYVNIGTCGFLYEDSLQEKGRPGLEHAHDAHHELSQKHCVCKYNISCKRKEEG